MTKISPSILTADFGHLADEIISLSNSGADWLHLDVMDNVFVPNMSFGQSMIRSLRGVVSLPFDVHLMIHDAPRYLAEFAEAGADIITVHPESAANTHLHRVVSQIRGLGKKAGIALNPSTHPDVLEYLYEELDLVLIMSVNPGYGGQKFIPQMLRKIEYVSERIQTLGLSVEVEVDGGINITNAKSVRDAGATVLVAGSAVVDAPNRAEAIRLLKGRCKEAV